MQLENSFTVPVPIDEAWRVLLDIERIAPCMPGAALDSVTGDDFTGRVKVKLGPINLTYQGKASLHREGRDRAQGGHRRPRQGPARQRHRRGDRHRHAGRRGCATRVDVLTDLNITGRPAQFGRGVMTDVGNKLLGQFADKLSAQLASGDARATRTGGRPAPAARRRPRPRQAWSRRSPPPPSRRPDRAGEEGGGRGQEDRCRRGGQGPAAAPAQVPDPTVPLTRTTSDTQAAASFSGTGTVEDDAPGTEPTPITAAKKAPSKPPTGTTAPPNRPAGGGPAKSTPAAAPRQLNPVEPEPIDLLEVAGGAAFTRFAAPAAGGRRPAGPAAAGHPPLLAAG